jgi:hypothetical protein
MLVANNGNFTKKATGRITFVCENGDLIERAIESIATGEGQTFWMKSIGTDEKEFRYLRWILNGALE